MPRNKKIVITGGLGFIFSHVTEHFLKQGYDVFVFDNLSVGSHPELIPALKMLGIQKLPGVANDHVRFSFFEKDVSFADVIPVIERIDPDYIIHAAAISDVDYSIQQPIRTIQANNNATTNIFEAARKCRSLKKLLYVSTDEVYGECDHPKTEEEILFPRNPYALSKAFGSLLRIAYDNTYPELKDKTCETRFCNVFGDRQDDRKIMPAIKAALVTGKPLKVHNGGTGYRQYIHVSAIPEIVERILLEGNRVYNITGGLGLTVNDLIALGERITGRKISVVRGKRLGMDARYEMSSARLYNDLGISPKSTEENIKLYFHD